MDERQQYSIESAVGNKVVIQLHRQAYDMLGLQGVESERFVARVVGTDGFGLWIENPNYCTVPVYGDDGQYIPPENRSEVCDRAVILIQWQYIMTIMQFPDRPNYRDTSEDSGIGFRRRPHGVVAEELVPIGVSKPEGGITLANVAGPEDAMKNAKKVSKRG